ncbi:MAG: PHP domain-containing protein [Acidobacteriia bacterium]|nr:PHP domain-containing protein [Terriglobia bacterium]
MNTLPLFDWHLHANYTDGHASVAECIQRANEKQLHSLALTEHVRSDSDFVEKYCSEVRRAAAESRVKVWCGAEVRILNERGDINLGKDAAQRFDLIVASVHRLPERPEGRDAGEAYCRALIGACENPWVDILGHPLHVPKELEGWTISETQQRSIARAAARHAVAIEVNRKYAVPTREFLKICLDEGCLFSVGSDAHERDDVGEVNGLLEILASLGVSDGALAPVEWKMI